MANFYWEAFPGEFAKDSIPHLISLDDNLINVYIGTFKLSPTASLGAWWAVYNSNGPLPYFIDVQVSSDTNIEVNWGRLNGGSGPALTTRGVIQLGRGGGSSNQNTFGADVHAGLSVFGNYGGAFIGANQPIQLVQKGWLTAPSSAGFFVSTAAVAANVYATMMWVEVLG